MIHTIGVGSSNARGRTSRARHDPTRACVTRRSLSLKMGPTPPEGVKLVFSSSFGSSAENNALIHVEHSFHLVCVGDRVHSLADGGSDLGHEDWEEHQAQEEEVTAAANIPLGNLEEEPRQQLQFSVRRGRVSSFSIRATLEPLSYRPAPKHSSVVARGVRL